ncbi:LOW QUALITY PROTEIN: leucine-rich PPR motif-containing protein, mitochondrial [Pholidichthys leucotaenia]
MFFHAATKKMAALLRSARLLKFSPSGLLQIAGTKRTGLPLGRLYSGAVCGGRSGICLREISPVCRHTSSLVWPYAAGCVRNFTVATERRDDAGVMVQSKQAQQFDWALAKLDNSVKRTGRITKTLLLRIFLDACRSGYPSSNQALLLLRSCGSLLPEVPQEERIKLAHRVWEKLKELGAQYDVSHYNALLKVYLQNEFKFSSTEFLAKMEAANVQPNRVTYQRLIAAYCQEGDIEGASTILEFMKSKDLPITEAVFSSLVTGHARAGDIESAKNILTVMKGAGIDPGPDTYVSLLNVYAEEGDLESIKQTLEAAERADCSLMDRDILHVILTLSKAGHHQHIAEMVERLRHERGYIPDAINLCLSLVTQGQEDPAFQILKTFPTLLSSNSYDSPNLGNFFLRHCINMDTSLEKIAHYCKELQASNLHSSPLTFTLYCALDATKTGTSLELMKLLKDQNLPVRPHYFWPLLTRHMKDENTDGVLEVMKGMQDLGMSSDAETLSRYILPFFPNIDVARQAFKDAGISIDYEELLHSQIRVLAVNNLAELYTQLSNPSFPSLDLNVFRTSLITGFKKSTNVEDMVKLTDLLYKDERFTTGNSTTADSTAFFLYNLIDSMSPEQVKAQEDILRKFFNQLQAQKMTISANIYKGIKNLLDFYHRPELIKDVLALVEPNEKVSNVSLSPVVTGTEKNMLALESRLAELKAENKPLTTVFRRLIQALCAEENLQRALELKQEYEDKMTVGHYATLISLCCRLNNVEEALNLKREISRKDSSVALDVSKYLALVKVLAVNGRIEDAVDILKEMKEKATLNDVHTHTLFHVLNDVAAVGQASTVQQLQDTIFTLGLAKPSKRLCGPWITAYLNSKDIPGAMEAVEQCQKRYNQLPSMHDIIVALVENGDTELLQKAMDFVSREYGEMMMMYDLFFGFLQTGRYREARKIIETPGLRAKPGRFQWYAEKCILNNQLEALEQMVDMTAKLFECDRDEMYNYILRLCKETNNWQKAEAVWMKMQEENLIPRERTLRLLADILKSNGQDVPFEVPEPWYEQAATTEQGKAPAAARSGTDYQGRLLALCKKGKAREAYGIMKDINSKGVALDPIVYDHLIRSFLAEGLAEDAMTVKKVATSHIPGFKLSDAAQSLLIITYSKKGRTRDALDKLKSMLQLDHLPMNLAINLLVQALGNQGDVAGIQEVESLTKSFGTSPNLSSMVFVNNTALAHIKNGDVASAVELLEGIYTSPDSTNPSMSFIFRKVLESGNDLALDKLNAMAERLANHFDCYKPASDLFVLLLDANRVEDAKFLLDRCNALAEQREVLLSFVAQSAQTPGQVGKIKNLLSLIPDCIEKEVLYPYLMKCHVLDKDLPAAKALHEQMQREGMVVDELSLKRLAVLYREVGETAPFPEPPESFRFYANKLKERAAKAQVAAEE